MVEQGTHKPLVVSSNLTLGTKDHHTVVFWFQIYDRQEAIAEGERSVRVYPKAWSERMIIALNM